LLGFVLRGSYRLDKFTAMFFCAALGEASMLRKIGPISCLALLFGSAAALSQDAPLTDCDRHAAALPFDKVDPAKAIPACIDAVSRNPNTPRLELQLGRAYQKSGKNEDAVIWYRKAAEKGNAIAQNNLGTLYFSGLGVPKDDTQAAVWYRKAADQGVAGAQSILGFMFENGRGVPKDDVQAVAWYRKAAEQGDANAQSNLAAMYGNGRGVAKDEAQAAVWYRKAAEQGLAVAQYFLGVMYESGLGVPKNDAQAIIWYRKAADQGNELAKEKLKKK